MSDENSNLPVKLSGANAPVPGTCGAKLRRSDPPRYCKRAPLTGRNRCRLHGGMTPFGADSPHWKGKGWSKYMPQRLADNFDEALNNPELTSLTAELALLDARTGELIKKLNTGDSETSWAHIEGEVMLMRKALEDNNSGQALMIVEKLQDYIRGADAERATWAELHSIIEQRRRLSDTERRREEMLSATMTANQAIMFVQALQRAINDEVPDMKTRQRLGNRIRQLISVNMGVGSTSDDDIEDVEAEITDDESDETEQP